jgi:Protein of unknown function (DUF742)
MSGPRRDPDMVRPYVRAGGRMRPTRALRLEMLVVAANVPTEGLDPDARRIISVCRGGVLAVADIAAVLDLPPRLALILVAGLMDDGCLTSPRPVCAHAPSTDVLREVLDGLRRSIA